MNTNPNTQNLSVVEHEKPNDGLRTCPLCAELVQLAAIRCKHCGADIGAKQSTDKSLSARATVGLVFFALLIAFDWLRSAAMWISFYEIPNKLPLLVWNSIVGCGMVAILIGATKRQYWGRTWMVNTAALQAFGLGFNLLAMWSKLPAVGVAILGLGFSAGVITLIAMRGTEAEFRHDQPIASDSDMKLTEPPLKVWDVVLTVALIGGAFLVQWIADQ